MKKIEKYIHNELDKKGALFFGVIDPVDYPDLDTVLNKIRAVKNSVIIDSEKLASEAGSRKAQNMVILGAASKHLILKKETLEEFIRVLFMSRSESLADMNVRAFRLGYNATS